MATLTSEPPHVAVCPGAGIGNLVPFLRLAAMLATSNTCKVTLVIILPTTSTAETTQITTFLTTHPHITPYYFHSLPPNPTDPTIDDPFLLQYDAVTRSAPLLPNHLTALTPPLSAVFSDFLLASGVVYPLSQLGIASFTLMVTSARFFSLMVSLLDAPLIKGIDVILPGVKPILADEPPPIMYNTEHAFVRLIIANAPHLCHGSNVVSWLDEQPVKSVVFVSFGSRTAMGKDQITELGEGLQRSGVRFLWIIKTTMVDKDDKEDLTKLLGDTFFELTKNRGLILKEFVNQEEVLSHPSIGGFLTHSGWNSVLESAQLGIPVLAWPPGGDQRVNAAVMKDAKLGIWEQRWGSENQGLIRANEIKDKIMELMTCDKLKANVERVANEAKKAWEIDGSSRIMFNKIIDMIGKTTKIEVGN
ncbi:hypothetical protein KSS87_003292 [Heliosperma pusillum]|nr:hypothetical protein KSS87_003292 [Heliosperma pusillum]